MVYKSPWKVLKCTNSSLVEYHQELVTTVILLPRGLECFQEDLKSLLSPFHCTRGFFWPMTSHFWEKGLFLEYNWPTVNSILLQVYVLYTWDTGGNLVWKRMFLEDTSSYSFLACSVWCWFLYAIHKDIKHAGARDSFWCDSFSAPALCANPTFSGSRCHLKVVRPLPHSSKSRLYVPSMQTESQTNLSTLHAIYCSHQERMTEVWLQVNLWASMLRWWMQLWLPAY